jgi:FtsP/CotA-like multicopper oxidase with cupredoxin domain
MAPGETELVAGRQTPTMGFNGSYLGPSIRISRGEQIQLAVMNQLGDPTTVHWHGMHLPPAMDGGPHQVIAPGETWRPTWTVNQPAATLWYHPHMMGTTREQVMRGLVGMFILDDARPVQSLLPHTYGVDDLPLILQDAVVGANGQLLVGGGGGGGGNTPLTLLDGSSDPWFETPARRLRLRLLNASAQRFYAISLVGDQPFHQIASDGGLLPAPVPLTRKVIGPAERLELVVDLSPEEPTILQAASTNNGGRGGGGNRPVGLLTLSTSAEWPVAGNLPQVLSQVDRIDPARANVTRDMVLARGGGRGGGGAFTINGSTMRTMEDMMHFDGIVRVQLGDTELWRVINESNASHVFHVHDVQFQIVNRNGASPTAEEAGWKDTIVVRPNETVGIIMTFTDYADLDHPYMYHCHLLNHEDQGMMGQFLVVPRSSGALPATHLHPGLTM